MIEGIIMMELVIMSYYDLRYKGLPKKLMILIGLIHISLAILNNQVFPLHIITGSILGIVLLIFAKITRQAIGYGDGLLFLFMGIVMGGVSITILFMISMVAVFLYGMILCAWKKANRKSQIPLVPFLAVSHLIYCVVPVMRNLV